MPGTVWVAYSTLYAALAHVGISPEEAGRLQVWQAAAALGVGQPRPEKGDVHPTLQNRRGGVPKGEASSRSRDLLRQRVLAAKGLAEPPTPEATSQDEVNAMMAAFAIPSK